MIQLTDFYVTVLKALAVSLKQTFLSARRVPGQVFCGLDDSRRSLGREGSGEERALPGPGVSPRLRGGEAEEPAQPKHKRVHLRADDLPVSAQTRGSLRVPLATLDPGGSGVVGRSVPIACLCSACILPATHMQSRSVPPSTPVSVLLICPWRTVHTGQRAGPVHAEG